MNLRIVAKLIGLLLAAFGASMTPSLLWSLHERDGAWPALVWAMAATLAIAGVLYLIGRRGHQTLFRKEATATVGLGWLAAAGCGALPFYFARLPEMPTYIDCYFEAMSGLTTTGASVLTDIESVPKGLLFWRSWTHFLGGLGIIMLFVAILPYLGAGGRALIKGEVTGPVKEGLTPRIKDTAHLLLRVYLGYTVVQTLLYWFLTEMPLFDALCHTFGALATGGFSTKNDSLQHYHDQPLVAIITIIFMMLAGMSFALMQNFFRGKSRALWRDPEWRAYMIVIALATVFTTLYLHHYRFVSSLGGALRDALFTVVSLMTTTGYVTADFEQWPNAVRCLLLALLFVGGCAGSTGGGMKVIRWIILLKIARQAVEKIYRPRRIRKLKLAGQILSDDLQQTTIQFCLIWMLIWLAGSLAIAVTENDIDMITTFSSVASTLNNIGPGFGAVGARENYAFFSPLSKVMLSLFMVLGRIELYSIMVLFIPRFWTQK